MPVSNHQSVIRQYLLGQLTDHEQETVEQRLVIEDDLFEELEVVKDELVDEYAAGRLSNADGQWFEANFLASSEGKRRLSFTKALNRYVVNHPQAQKKMGFSQRLSSFWTSQPSLARVVAAVVVFAVIAGIVWVSRTPSPNSFATATLTNIHGTRASGVEVKQIKLKEDELRLSLALPSSLKPANRYRVELLNQKGETKTSEVQAQDTQSVVVVIPAAELPRGYYVINLSTISPDGSVQRIGGGYHFAIE